MYTSNSITETESSGTVLSENDPVKNAIINVKERTISLDYNGEKTVYSLISLPNVSSPLVQQARTSILHELEFSSILTGLKLSSDLIYVAYCALAGTQVQSKISHLEYELLKLCGDATISAGIMQNNTQEIALSIANAYRYLLKGKLEQVEALFNECSRYALDMSKESQKIADRFTQLADLTDEANNDSIDIMNLKYEESNNIKKKAAELESKKAVEEKKLKELVKQIEELNVMYQNAKEEEKEESQKAFVLQLLNTLTSAVGAGLNAYVNIKKGGVPNIPDKPDEPKKETPPNTKNNPDDNTNDNGNKNGKSDSSVILQNKFAADRARIESLTSMEEFTYMIRNLKEDENHAITAVKTMSLASQCLSKVATSLSNVSMFWNSMSAFCKTLSVKNIKVQAGDLTDLLVCQDQDTIYSMYVCINYLAQWTALNDVCKEYVQTSEEVRKQVGSNLEKAPEIKRALEEAPKLAEKLHIHIQDEMEYMKTKQKEKHTK